MNSRRIGRWTPYRYFAERVRSTGWAATLVLAAMAAPSIARAQGSRYDNIVLSPQGKPLAAATVAVCTAAASTTTTPCSPLATVYTDATLTTPAANPLTADGLGNYGFWAPPGKYLVQIYGSGITTKVNTVILPCDPTSNCTMGASSAISAFSLNLSGNLSVAGSLSYNGGKTPAGESLSTDAVQYVSPNGNDTNDGLSWGTAKLTVMAAYDALPAAGGTIFVTGCAYGTGCTAVSATSTAGQGIWILGTGDPNFNSPPAGWRKFKPTRFIGVGGAIASQNATSGVATAVLAGSNTAPAIWLSGVQGIEFRNLEFQYPSIVIRVGVDSNGSRSSGAAANSNIVFHNIAGFVFNSPGSASFGPTVDIGSNVLWLLLNECTFQGNSAAAANTDNRAAVLINTGGGPASGLIYIQKTHFQGGGGIRFYANMNGTGSVYVRDGLQEGAGQSQPILEIIGTGVFIAQAENVSNSDSGDSPPVVRVAAGNPPSFTTVISSDASSGVTVEGPATVLNSGGKIGSPSVATLYGGALANVSPAAKFQAGDFAGRTLNQVDAHRRSFAPSVARFANNLQGSTQLPSSWTANTGTITTGVTALDGTTNAAKVTGNAAGALVFSGTAVTYAAGDYIYAGVWAQQASTAGPYFSQSVNGALALRFDFGNNPTFQLLNGSSGAGMSGNNPFVNPVLQTDGGWQWIWFLVKVTTPPSGAVNTRFALQASTTNPMNYYAPMFVQIPASSVALVSPPTFSSASESANTVTLTTTAAHNLSVGEPIVLSGCSISGYNGGFAIATVPTATTFTYFDSNTGLGSPTGCVITPGNDSEVADWALSASSYADNAPSNSVAGLRGESLTFGANGSNFFGTLSHANTTNRTYTFPDATGNVVLDSAAQTLSAKTFSSPTLSGHLNLSSANGDVAGQISISGATSGSKTFATAYTSAPVCAASPTSNPGSTTWWVTTSATAVTINLSASSTITFNYTCKGNPN